MRIGTPSYVGVLCFFTVAHAQAIDAAEPVSIEAGTDPAASELEKLGAEYRVVQQERLRALPPDGGKESDGELSDEEWMRQGLELQAKYPGPDEVVLPRLLALAEKYPQSPYSLDALAFVIMRGGYQTGDVHGEPWKLKEQAIDLVAENHMDDSRVVFVFKMLAGSLPSRKTETFLRHAFEHGPSPTVRAAAGYNLACYYRRLGTAQRAVKADKESVHRGEQ